MRRWCCDSKWNMEYHKRNFNKEGKMFYISAAWNIVMNDFDDTEIKLILMSRDAIRGRKCINARNRQQKIQKNIYTYSHRSRIIIIIETTKPIFHSDVHCFSWFGLFLHSWFDTSYHSKNDKFYIFYVSCFHFNCSYLVLYSLCVPPSGSFFCISCLHSHSDCQRKNVISNLMTIWKN